MCETWLEFACRPATLTSTVVLAGATVTVIVPAAPTPGSGLSLKMRPLGLEDTFDEVSGLGEGDGDDPDVSPQAAAQTAHATHETHAMTDVHPARQHSVGWT